MPQYDDYLRLGFTVVEQRQIFHDNAAALLTRAEAVTDLGDLGDYLR